MVICGTETVSPFYSKFIPPIFTHSEYTPETLEKFYSRQTRMKDKIEHSEKKVALTGGAHAPEEQIEQDPPIDARAFLVMDDVSSDTSWLRDDTIRGIFMNGRHLLINYFLVQHYPLGIRPDLRTNIDFVFIMRENNMQNRRRLYENYAGVFPDFKTFCATMDALTEDYGCMVINNNCKSNKIEDIVFWYKAEEHTNFKMCSEQAWDFNNKNYRPKSYTDALVGAGKGGRGGKVVVKIPESNINVVE
jgi:hypothetical protein